MPQVISIDKYLVNTDDEYITSNTNKSILVQINTTLKKVKNKACMNRVKICILSETTEYIKKVGYLPNNIYYQASKDACDRYIITGIILPIPCEFNDNVRYIKLYNLLTMIYNFDMSKAHITINKKVLSSVAKDSKADLYSNLYLVTINQEYRIFVNGKSCKLFSDTINKIHGIVEKQPVLTFGELLANITRE